MGIFQAITVHAKYTIFYQLRALVNMYKEFLFLHVWILKIATLRDYPYTKEFFIFFFFDDTVVQCGPSIP
jgi:hypothetical protein